MPISFNAPGVGFITPGDVWYQDGPTKRRLKQVAYHDGSGIHVVFDTTAPGMPPSSLAVAVSPSNESDVYDSLQQGGGFAYPFNAVASGGAGGYSYAWSRVSATSDTATADGTSTDTLTLSANWPIKARRSYSETWRVTATDAAGTTATATISIYERAAPNAS